MSMVGESILNRISGSRSTFHAVIIYCGMLAILIQVIKYLFILKVFADGYKYTQVRLIRGHQNVAAVSNDLVWRVCVSTFFSAVVIILFWTKNLNPMMEFDDFFVTSLIVYLVVDGLFANFC